MRVRSCLMFAFVLLLSVSTMVGCNTVRGIGKDVQRGGDAIERAAK